jgi:hypothetical protein
MGGKGNRKHKEKKARQIHGITKRASQTGEMDCNLQK